ncbi:MMPL family transporter [Evansella cellulosilytica]|uniref:MmpL domain protein n=1 Tax=Evansella cellulosilytica (strain ATCC 21833 / DSM 2522 / FERM P-1141 / JCM 9156 / N-4) TaxID=649639 RepID=E6U120_EVAC2|nr:MMPL family transporter [Evansella cellulosilytica]ADU30332.1 MmpL domain protein [Evansella cellulosilytica DSM 2522]
MVKGKANAIETYANWFSKKRSKWIVLFLWIGIALLLNLTLPQANSLIDDSAGNLDKTKSSSQAAAIIDEEFSSESGIPALVVWHKLNGIEQSDLKYFQEIVEHLTENPLPYQDMVPPFHNMPREVLEQQVSEDGTTLILPIFFQSGVDAGKIEQDLLMMSEQIESIIGFNPFEVDVQSGELSARVSGPAGILVDATQLFSAGDFSLTIITFVLVLTVLLLIYRSPILAFIPLIGVAFAYMVISPILGWLAYQGWITYDSQGISIMTVLLFGAGTDYCLFLISRFRYYLELESNKLTALKLAISDKGGAILMSGLTTVFALSLLLLADFGPIQRFSIPFVVAIFVVALSSVTLVPSLLAVLGRRAFFPFIPRTFEMEKERAKQKGKRFSENRNRKQFGEKVRNFVINRFKVATIVTTIVLIALASAVFQIEYTYDTLSSFPDDMPSKEGFALIGDSFHEGQLAPVSVIVDTKGHALDLTQTLEELSYIKRVSDPEEGQNNKDIVMINVELDMNPYSNEAMDVIPELKEVMSSSLLSAGIQESNTQYWIGGQTAEQYEIRETSNRDVFVLVPLIIAIIATLVFLYLKSLTAMLYLTITVIISYFSALGLGWLVIHYLLGADAIQGFIPLYVFIFLGALGVDYNLFLKSSIWKKAPHMPLKQAIQESAAETGPVINSAGVILAGTFSVLATLPIQILVHFGIITAIGVLIDTFIVRPFLVPAITAWLGEKAFWPAKRKALN